MSFPSLSLQEIASLTGSKLVGDANYRITAATSLQEASPTHISFLQQQPFGQSSTRYKQEMLQSQAGAIIVAENTELPNNKNILISSDPSRAFQQTLEHFLQVEPHDYVTGFSGIHPSAVIHEQALIAKDTLIGPFAVIEKGACIQEGAVIGAHSFVGAETVIGKNTTLHAHVTIRERCRVGQNCILHPGSVIGACGFGYTSDATGHHKLRQLGSVIIEDQVEIGANSCIDRARFSETRIGKGTKIDNLVQIGHGVHLGEHNLIVGQVGIAGSTTTGKRVVMAGQCAINGHIHITDDVILAARSGVISSIKEPGKYAGAPVQPLKLYLRNIAAFCKLGEYVGTLKKMLRGQSAK